MDIFWVLLIMFIVMSVLSIVGIAMLLSYILLAVAAICAIVYIFKELRKLGEESGYLAPTGLVLLIVFMIIIAVWLGGREKDTEDLKSSAEQNEEEIALKDEEDVAGNNGIPSDAVSYNDHYYKLFVLGGTFEEAEEYCLSLGGYLAVITDQKENDFLFSYMKSCGYENAFFGFSDQEDEGVWAWLGTEEKSSFTNWASGEPNSENSEEDYAMFFYKYPDGKWNDGTFGNGTNSYDTAFLCEWKGTGFANETKKEEEIQSPFSQKYWIIFTEGSRNDRVEASSIDSSIDPDKLYFVWNTRIDLNNMTGSGECNQFFLNDSEEWERIGTYYRMSENATKILYSSLDVYDADGNLIIEKSSSNDIDWETIRSLEGAVPSEEIQSPFSQKYWIIFTEGSRDNRVEASSIDSSIDPDELYFVWNSGIDLNNMTDSGECNQFFLNDSEEWERIGTYYRMSGNATKILYSSLDVYDADGNLIIEKSSSNDIDWETIRSLEGTEPGGE